jgi:hypothetical protein
MAKVSLTSEECVALRSAAERIPAGKRSRQLVAALQILSAVMAAVERGRMKLDEEKEPPTSADQEGLQDPATLSQVCNAEMKPVGQIREAPFARELFAILHLPDGLLPRGE